MPALVFIKGPKGHGKSTAAQALIADGWTSISFAAPLKAACALIFGLTEEEMEDAVIKETPLTRWPYLSPRRIMQHVGTDLFRNWLDETWIRAFDRAKREAFAAGRNVVCPDLRFPNEAEYANARVDFAQDNGLIVEVVNPAKAQGQDGHASEALAAGIAPHVRITNDGTVDALHAAIRRAVVDGRARLPILIRLEPRADDAPRPSIARSIFASSEPSWTAAGSSEAV